jgi:hypothetical protein
MKKGNDSDSTYEQNHAIFAFLSLVYFRIDILFAYFVTSFVFHLSTCFVVPGT